MRLFVLYFNHSPKIYENIKYYEEEGTSKVGDFYFNLIETYYGCDWFILNLKTGQGIIMYKGKIRLTNIASAKDLTRFIRIFRNEFIGSKNRYSYREQYDIK